MKLSLIRYPFPFQKPRLAIKIERRSGGTTIYYSLGRVIAGAFHDLARAVRSAYTARDIALGGCSRCGSFWRLHWRPSMTAYAPTEANPDPNQPTWYCEPCGEDHDDYWTAMWDEYNHSRG